ncbi:acyl-CoA carboxylase epsilon subunit [Pseudonocardia acaciae]|uniref:acyl-CoA carboxylase epsilon subunit n=1 Tax=Pseudonocardia acaciae TaxID=551276 RepID=UPI00048CC98D|nr:acyl-CoA carboxylase epsilon subunit [Pseudonocardia acaciae]
MAEQTPDEQTPEQRRALFRVVRGDPDDAELAALTAVLAAAASTPPAPAAEDARGRSVWVDRAAALRPPLHPGPGAWRASTLPR